MRRKQKREDVRLRRLLTTAARRFAAVHGPIRSEYDIGSEIAHFVLECRNGIEHGTLDLAQEEELVRIFAPAGDWDKVVGGEELGNEVSGLLDWLCNSEVEVCEHDAFAQWRGMGNAKRMTSG